MVIMPGEALVVNLEGRPTRCEPRCRALWYETPGRRPIRARMIQGPSRGTRRESRRPVPRDVPRLRAAKFTSRAGVGSRPAYSAGPQSRRRGDRSRR
jgi:hypothetical protein